MSITKTLAVQTLPLGLKPYADAYSLQKQLHQEVAEGNSPPTVLILEHPPTITLGSSGRAEHLLLPAEFYRERGIAVHQVERGGQATYHGPGQLVCYPIVPMPGKVGDFLRMIERVVLRTLDHYGIAGRGNPGYAGVWAGEPEGKIAAVGIAVRRRVAFHGFALNVATKLDDFNMIVPCGEPRQRVTSLELLLGTAPPMDEVAKIVGKFFEDEYLKWRAECDKENS